MSQRFYIPFTQQFTNLGYIAPGWKLKTYQTNTSTPLATYSDAALNVPNANPANPLVTSGNQVADANGRFGDMFVDSSALYKLVLTDENDVVIETTDPVDPFTVNLAVLQPRPLFYAGTTTGTSTAYVLVADPAFTEYSDTDIFALTFNQACGANPTLTYVAGGSALNMKKYDGNGIKVNIESGDLQNQRYIVTNDGVDVIVLNPEIIQNLKSNHLTANTSLQGALLTGKRAAIANNGSDTNNDINFISGIVPDYSNNYVFNLAAITKRLDANWAAGNNQGGLDTGSKTSNTWYYCYGIYNTSTNTSDAIFTATYGSPTLPTGYTISGYIGPIRTDGSSNIRPFTQNKSRFDYKLYIEDRALAAPPATPTNITLTVPPSSTALTTVYMENNGGAFVDYYLFVNPSYSNTTPSSTNYTGRQASAISYTRPVEVLVNNSSVAVFNANSTNGFMQILTEGFIDNNL